MYNIINTRKHFCFRQVIKVSLLEVDIKKMKMKKNKVRVLMRFVIYFKLCKDKMPVGTILTKFHAIEHTFLFLLALF